MVENSRAAALTSYDKLDDRDAAFFENVARETTLERKSELLWGLAQEVGFTDIFYCRLNDPGSATPYNTTNIEEYRYGDERWHSLYRGLRYDRFDWAVERASWEKRWFLLDEPPKNLSLNQEKFLRHASEHNRQNGFCFPINGSFALKGGFSATGCKAPPSQSMVLRLLSALQLAELTIDADQEQHLCGLSGLNERELKALRMLAAGRSMTQIAHITGKSDQWIRLSFSQVREKMGVGSNTQLVYRAAKMGLI